MTDFRALGIAPSRVSRSMRSGGPPFDINGCLKLAKVTGVPADTVLRAAGKQRTADLIREVYYIDAHAASAAPLPEAALEIARLYLAIDPRYRDIQRAVEQVLRLVQTEQMASGADAIARVFVSTTAHVDAKSRTGSGPAPSLLTGR